MARKTTTPSAPTEFMRNPEGRASFDLAEIVDVDTGRMLIPSSGGLIMANGAPIKRAAAMTLREAMIEAARWWNAMARFAMPDQHKTKGLAGQDYLCEFGMASGVLLGYPWENLAKDEKLSVLRAWWINVGVPRFVGGLGTSQIEKEIIQ